MTEAQIPVAPLDRFAIAPENPRKIRSDDWIDELAASLASSGVITPVICYDEGGKLQITAGGTRFLAAQHARLTGLPYDIRPKQEAITAGLVEQEGHSPLHPADQAEAYAAELDRMQPDGDVGPSWDDARASAILQIANRGGKTVRFVEQRLALAALHPPILKALRENKLGLDQASAWANAPAERQADVWKDLGARALRLDTRGIRAALDKADLAADDRLVKFAGRERYAAQGGMIRQDLFPIDVTGEVKLDAKPAEHFDRDAVKRAARDRLEQEANKYRAQGWGFVLTKAGSVVGAPSGYTIGKPCTTKEQKAKAGVSLSIGYDGKLVAQLNLRKQAEKKPAAAEAVKVEATTAKQSKHDRDAEERADATASTIVGRAMLKHPHMAMAFLAASFARGIFSLALDPACKRLATPKRKKPMGDVFNIGSSNLGVRSDSRHALASDQAWADEWNSWVERLQAIQGELEDGISLWPDDDIVRLIAFCMSACIEIEHWQREGGLAHLQLIGKMVEIDYADIELPGKPIPPAVYDAMGGLPPEPSTLADAIVAQKKPAAKAKKSRGSK